MTSIQLLLPQEILDEADLPYEGVRDVSNTRIAIDSLSVASSIITLTTLRAYLVPLADAIKRWRSSTDHRDTVMLTVKSDRIDLKVPLKANVRRVEILDALRPLLDDDSA